MLAGRLVRLARDVLWEYSEFKVQELLAEASSLSAQRPHLQDQQYIQRARQIRAAAEQIIKRSRIEQYPSDLRDFLKDSTYSSGLPENIARVLIHGFPDDKNAAISSAELGIYSTLTSAIIAELKAIDTAANKLSIEEIIIPDNTIGLDVLIPRDAYKNRPDEIFEIFAKFSNIMSYFIEMATGSQGAPSLVYTSTTDPVTGFALIAGAAWGFLRFYKLVLEVAEKQLGLLKTVRELRTSGLSDTKFDDKVKELVESQLNSAVAAGLLAVPPKVPPERVREIEIAIKKEAPFILKAVSNGARVGITIEGLDRLSLISEAIPDVQTQEIDKELNDLRQLEHQVQTSLLSLGTPAPALLTAQEPKSTSDEPKG